MATVAELLEHLERMLGRPAQRQHLPAQPVYLPATHADTGPLAAAIGFAPSIPLEQGLQRFVDWLRDYRP